MHMSKKASKKKVAKKAASTKSKPAAKSVAKSVAKSAKPVSKKAGSVKAKAPAKKATKPAKAAKSAGSSAVAASSTVMRDRAIEFARFAHGMTNRFASGFAEDQVLAQPAGVPNHLIWTLGHLSATAGWLHNMITGAGSTVPASYEGLFGMGSKPHGDASAYPTYAEVQKAFDDSFEALVAAASKMSDAELLQPAVGETGGFLKDRLDALSKAAWHEGWHLGQIADLRRALGLPAAF
jgi:outer membrane biosynthesis protein TonB